jgi:hypothetical protein
MKRTASLFFTVLLLHPALALPQKELFFAEGWSSHCRAAMERITLGSEKPGDGEVNGECVSYVMGIADTSFLLLLGQKKCTPERADRQAVLTRSLEIIEKTSIQERKTLPMVNAVGRVT